jgi:hypothetical protein
MSPMRAASAEFELKLRQLANRSRLSSWEGLPQDASVFRQYHSMFQNQPADLMKTAVLRMTYRNKTHRRPLYDGFGIDAIAHQVDQRLPKSILSHVFP